MGVLAAMERSQLEHLIRAASAIADDYELVVIGSQSILGTIPFPPESLIASIGEGAPFEQEFGYYAQGVGPETAVLPSGWEQRLVKVQAVLAERAPTLPVSSEQIEFLLGALAADSAATKA